MDFNDDAGCLNHRGVWAFFVGTPPGASSLLQGLIPEYVHGQTSEARPLDATVGPKAAAVSILILI